MLYLTRFLITLLMALGLTANGIASGSTTPATKVERFAPDQLVSFAKKVEEIIASKGARVAILARMGKPLAELPEGMHFTHVAFAVYSEIDTANRKKVPGYTIYNLYQKNNQLDVSELVQDFPVDFFSEVAKLEAGIIIPTAEFQQRLLKVIASDTYKNLHDSRYSLIANPYTLGRQNCTEFVLDVMSSAIYETSDISVIKANQKAYFKPQRVNVSPLKLWLGSIFSAEVSISDHPSHPETATFEKIADFLKQYDEGSEVMHIYSHP